MPGGGAASSTIGVVASPTDKPRVAIERAIARRRRLPRLTAPVRLSQVLLTLGGLAVLLVTVSATSARAVRGLVLLALLSVFFAHLVAPLARGLREAVRKRGQRLPPAAALLVVYGAITATVLVAWLLMGARLQNQVVKFSDVVPRQVTTALDDTATPWRWRRFLGISEHPRTALGSAGVVLSDWTRVHVAEVLRDVLEQRWVLPWLAIVPVVSFILLTQFPRFRRSTLRALPEGHIRWRGTSS